MLIQQTSLFGAKTRFVNKALTGTALTAMAVITSTSAQAWSVGNIVTTEHKVKISTADLTTNTGVEEAYAKLTKKAEKLCAIGTTVDSEGDIQTKEACQADMLSQFVRSAAIDSLTTYHKAKLSSRKMALLKTR